MWKICCKGWYKVDSKLYLYNNKPLSINPELNKTFGQQINSTDTGDKEITVLDDPDKEYTVKLHYEGYIKEVKIKQNEKYGSLFSQIGNYFSLKAKSFYALCNGVLVEGEDDLDKSISQLSNAMNKETNEINLLIETNDSFSDEDDNEDNNDIKAEQKPPKIDEMKVQEIKINERKKVAKFLLKIYVILLVQFSLIASFIGLGFYKGYDKIFTGNIISICLTDFFLCLFIIYISILILKYKKNMCHCCIYFHILIYIPFIIILSFLLSAISKDKILSIIILIVIDIISVILFLLIFKRNRGYGILLLSLVLNAIYILPLYIIYYKEDFITINAIFSLASVFVFYVLFFNNIAKKKLDENEGVVAVYFFDYSFFLHFSIGFFILFASVIIIPLCILVFVLAYFLLVLICVIISLFGAGFILLFITIKVYFSLFCKSKKNLKINKLLNEIE